jgi:hypothetical protein
VERLHRPAGGGWITDCVTITYTPVRPVAFLGG